MWFSSKKYDVICIGSASQDVFLPTAEGIILETPEDVTAKVKVAFELGGKYRIQDRYEALGGVAANVASGLSRLGHMVAAYTCVGDDDLGQFIINTLHEEGVETGLVRQLKNTKTDLSAIVVLTQNGERTIFHNRDANEHLSVDQSKLSSTKWLFVSALNGAWQDNLEKIIAAKKTLGLKLAMNPGQHNIKDEPKKVFEALHAVDVLLLNKDEAVELLLHLDPQPTKEQLDDEFFLLEHLAAQGVSCIGLTDGQRGAWAYDGTNYWHCPILTRNGVVDSTGAGDAFGSGFFAAYLHGLALEDALRYGIANSGSVIGFFGAITGLLHRKEMEEIITHIFPVHLKKEK